MDYFTVNTPFDFIKEPRDILKALLDSKDSGTAIWIKSAVLGKGMFVTAVEDILIGDGHENTEIILKVYDFTGHVLEKNTMRLSEIEGVCCFSSKFGNPILKTISKLLKIWFTAVGDIAASCKGELFFLSLLLFFTRDSCSFIPKALMETLIDKITSAIINSHKISVGLNNGRNIVVNPHIVIRKKQGDEILKSVLDNGDCMDIPVNKITQVSHLPDTFALDAGCLNYDYNEYELVFPKKEDWFELRRWSGERYNQGMI